jgi:hypothetical protein
LNHLISQVAKQINCGLDLGIKVEIKEALRRQENVKEFKVEEEDQKYKITIKLKDYNSREARKVFKSLVNFIEYTGLTFYVSEVHEETTEYLLVSSMENMTGYLCRVIFLNSNDVSYSYNTDGKVIDEKVEEI